MFNASDYLFDERVRKAAAHYPLLYVVPDWELFKKKLDKELPIKKKRRFSLSTGIVAINASLLKVK